MCWIILLVTVFRKKNITSVLFFRRTVFVLCVFHCSFLSYLSGDILAPKKPSARKTKLGKEVKEVIEPEIKRARFSTLVEKTISTYSVDFLDADRDMKYIYFGSITIFFFHFFFAPILFYFGSKLKEIVTAVQMVIFYSSNVRVFLKIYN